MRNRWMWGVAIAGLCWSIAPCAMAKSASQSAQVIIIIPERPKASAPASSEPSAEPVRQPENPIETVIREDNAGSVRYTKIID